MDENIKKTCDEIVAKTQALRKSMFWEISSDTYAVMAGIITTGKGVEADPVKYKECKKLIREKVNLLSEIRGISEAVVATKMMVCDDPEEYIQGVVAVYKKLRSIHKLTASPYMVMAAMNIYEHAGLNGMDADIQKLESLYADLKKKHPLLISDSDRGYLSLLIASELNVESSVEAIESAYESCRKASFDRDAVHTLSQVLALSTLSAEAKNEFVTGILNGLKENKKYIHKCYGLSAVAALATLDIPANVLVQEITEVDDYLKQFKGFKWYNFGARTRVIYSSLAVFVSHVKDSDGLVSSDISSNIAMNIAEDIVIFIILMASISASNAARSSSN